MYTKHKTPNIVHPTSGIRHKTTSITNRVIALFLTFTVLLPCATPYGNILANNNGPNAPEAASFEPVDATDMVNLLTGDFSYVLPLMNVPSPEGGYPIALSYHGGVAMDLESSWVGLGWNLNPGAINRSVNGYPDDYSNTIVTDYFYDSGQTITTSSFSAFYTNGAVSVGVGASWGSHQSTAGSVSIGFGLPGGGGVNTSIGTNGVSVGVGYNFNGLSLGASVSSNGKVVGTAGAGFNSNGTGFSVGASTNGTFSIGFSQKGNNGNSYSLGIDFSSEGTSLSVGASHQKEINGKSFSGSHSVGIGANNSFNTTFNQGDYTTNRSSKNIGLFIPTPVGIFGFSFGSQKIKIFAAKKTEQLATGPLYFGNSINSEELYHVICVRNFVMQTSTSTTKTFSNLSDAESYETEQENINCAGSNPFGQVNYCLSCRVQTSLKSEAFMDTYEIPIQDEEKLSSTYDITLNNPVFPSYDSYNVQAQGLSGSIHATLIDNGRLFGLSKEIERFDGQTTKIDYEYDGLHDGEVIDKDLTFRKRPEFYFDNEISSYLNTPKANFRHINEALSTVSIKDVLNGLEGDELTTNRFKKSNHIEYATNEELLKGEVSNYGFLKPNTSLDRRNFPTSGIGAYKITAPDGKTYHYSLPVYNHEIITRAYGSQVSFKNNKECEAYIEKRQLEPYATHWLLTAVTGPDFVDNGDGLAGEGDLGYWVNFDYGLWSDAYVWSPHPSELYVGGGTLRTWTRGRKQLYYLDKVSTRTHTAVFIKSEDDSNPSLDWVYESVAHDGSNQNCENHFNEKFHIPSHKRLKLDRVLLLKNEDLYFEKNDGLSNSSSVEINYNDSYKESLEAGYNLKENVYDTFDYSSLLASKAIKEIELRQNYDLSNDQLSLNTVNFKGKRGANVIPPYQFDYYVDNTYTYNKEDANEWGYNKFDSKLWSLKEIETPQGAKIEVDYDNHQFKSVTTHEYDFEIKNFYSNQTYTFEVSDFLNFIIGKNIFLEANFVENITLHNTEHDFDNFMIVDFKYDRVRYSGEVEVVKNYTQNNKNYVTLSLLSDLDIQKSLRGKYNEIEEVYDNDPQFILNDRINEGIDSYIRIDINDTYKDSYAITDAGPRVKTIRTTNGDVSYTTNYNYGENEDGIGWVSYIPYAPNSQEEAPYSKELPSPRPMYEYVTMNSEDINGKTTGKTTYQFNVIKHKEEDYIKYADLYELTIDREEKGANSSKTVAINEYTIHDNLNNIGQLLSVSTYNENNQLLSKLTNDYYDKGELPDNLGVTQESYQSYKKIIENEGENDESQTWLVNSSTRVKYPNLLKSSTELKNGVSYTTTFSDFDLISGQAKQTHSKSSLGLEMKTVSEPAFYHYPAMGSKADDINNKNMLTQSAQTLSYFKDENSKDWELYGAEVDTWKPYVYNEERTSTVFNEDGTKTSSSSFIEKNIWRKHQKYIWKSDLNENGSYKNFTSFDYNKENQSEGWQRLSEITKYSDYSRALETIDINGNKASNRLGDNSSKVMAVANTSQDRMFYANFEYSGDYIDASGLRSGFGVRDEAIIVSDKAHTGRNSLKIDPSLGPLPMLAYFRGYEEFKASVWVHKDNYKNTEMFSAGGIINFNPNEVVEAGDWVQLNFNFSTKESISNPIIIRSASGVIYIDDFRIHPISSGMTSYVYNKWDELSYIIGPNNMATKYEYDSSGRLIKTYKEVAKNASTDGGFKLINESNYNYKNQ